MRFATAILSVLLLLPVGAAEAGPASFYPSGSMSFSYNDILSSTSGSYSAAGSLLDLTTFPAPGSGATSAACVEWEGTTYLLVVSGRQNADLSIDAAFIWLAGPSPMGTGTYPLDLTNYTALFGYVDGASDVQIPDPNNFPWTDWMAWVDLIVANNKFVGAAGTVTVLSMDSAQISGIFQVTAVDAAASTSVVIPDGIFNLGNTVSVDDHSWGSIKAEYAE